MRRAGKPIAELVVWLGDEVVGRLTNGPAGKLTFTYDEAWRTDPNASIRLEAHDHMGRERLCRYLTRPAFSLERIPSVSVDAPRHARSRG